MAVEKFKALNVNPKGACDCVDGRGFDGTADIPQMLGGSIHPLILLALFNNTAFTKEFVCNNAESLVEAGYTLGGHRGAHANAEQGKSDCGFSDNLAIIVEKAQSSSEEILSSLVEILGSEAQDGLSQAFEKIQKYDSSQVKIFGEDLIALLEELDAHIYDLHGDHHEKVAFVNLVKGTSFDTVAADQNHEQAFNLDLWLVLEQSEVLQIDEDFAKYASLILYAATKTVLVTDKGKPDIPVLVNS